ncbi:hypothetical protein RB195_020977 [Necator americanus]|uniref:SXP/RAL-2 family protein Ani s 5-like cation-binding domain-containing protein n=1 Tax=Necator americanus TaxID=51031 RepID=A0ABR1CLH8_NECAM
MYHKVLYVCTFVSVSYAIWPRGIKPGESAALDLVMRVSRMTSKDLNYIRNLQFWGKNDDEILEQVRRDDPILYEKITKLRAKYVKLSSEARDYIDDVFRMAVEHTRSFNIEQYFTPEQIGEAIRLVGQYKNLPFRLELEKAFPDIDAYPPLIENYNDV